jgi:protein-disulfide isomerase
MLRRLFVHFFRRSVIAMLLLCLGCAAQSSTPEIQQRIERQLRGRFSIPADVQISVGPRTPSKEFPNYDQVEITLTRGERKQMEPFLLSKDSKTLIRMTKLDISKDPYAAIMAKINLSGRPVRGNPDAKVTIVSYDDFQCPFCSRMHFTLFQDIMKTYGDRVKVVYKDFPLAEIHPWAMHAAVNANCLAQQSSDAYWEFADYLHANQHQLLQVLGNPKELQGQNQRQLEFAALDKIAVQQGEKHKLQLAPLQACLKAQSEAAVRASVEEASSLGVQATPALFINGEKIDGAVPAEVLRATIERALKDAGQPVPAAGK